RQVGKTTLARSLTDTFAKRVLYLDLENPLDLLKLSDPLDFITSHTDALIVLDEVHRMPALFPILRGIIDENRRNGISNAQFLILGSASLDLLKQSSESLAGRIAYLEIGPLTIDEVAPEEEGRNRLWLRGGFPDSLLAKTDRQSFNWRNNFINTYLERDIPQFGLNVPATRMRRLWTMLCHLQGDLINYSSVARSMDITSPTLKSYLDFMEGLFLIRRLQPWYGNLKKRLVKTPKIYIRDSGVYHTLLNISQYDQLLNHPDIGASWEAWVIENLLQHKPDLVIESFYRSSAGAEIDLVLEAPNRTLAIEIKKSLAPKVSKGFHIAADDIKATERYVVYRGDIGFPISKDIQVITVREMQKIISAL
ncbi:MAG: ATP-binding protein, partial [Bacteroidota bacterium]